jgi:hypothetical protein
MISISKSFLAMGNHNNELNSHFGYIGENFLLGLLIECTSTFIEDEDFGLFKESAGDCQSLFLATTD